MQGVYRQFRLSSPVKSHVPLFVSTMLMTDYLQPTGRLNIKFADKIADGHHQWRSQSQPNVHLKERCGGGDLNSRSGCGMWKPKGAPCPHCQRTAKQFGLIDTQQSTLTPMAKLSARLGKPVHLTMPSGALMRSSSVFALRTTEELLSGRRYDSTTAHLSHEEPPTRRPSSAQSLVPGGNSTGRRSPAEASAVSISPSSRSAPIFEDEAKEMKTLATALREAAMCRTECAHALDHLASDFEREFRPGIPSRPAASSLVVKSSTIASRLSTACFSLEAAAAT
jgi:hypothetical protein